MSLLQRCFSLSASEKVLVMGEQMTVVAIDGRHICNPTVRLAAFPGQSCEMAVVLRAVLSVVL